MKDNLEMRALLCAALVGCLLQTVSGNEKNAWSFKEPRAWAR